MTSRSGPGASERTRASRTRLRVLQGEPAYLIVRVYAYCGLDRQVTERHRISAATGPGSSPTTHRSPTNATVYLRTVSRGAVAVGIARGTLSSGPCGSASSSRPPSPPRMDRVDVPVSLRRLKAMVEGLEHSNPLRIMVLGEPTRSPGLRTPRRSSAGTGSSCRGRVQHHLVTVDRGDHSPSLFEVMRQLLRVDQSLPRFRLSKSMDASSPSVYPRPSSMTLAIFACARSHHGSGGS